MTLRLGVIGLSEGNGHPFSWSAIINGYSPENMQDCGFPVIPQYLSEQQWPDARIKGAEATHVWTESRDLSTRISRASLIKNVVSSPEELIGKVDGVLLARDDAENHMRFAEPFLRAGLPIYIDKPIALSITSMDALYSMEQYEGQIFSCSALRYAHELMLDELAKEKIGEIQLIQAVTPKSWKKYAVHIIEPVLNILGNDATIRTACKASLGDDGISLNAGFSSSVSVQFNALGSKAVSPILIRVYGDKAWHDLVFSDSFHAFKAALQDFIDGVRTKTCRSPRSFNEKVVSLIEAGIG